MILPSKDSDEAKHKESINNLSANLESKVQMNNTNISAPAKATTKAQQVGHKLNTTTLEINQNFQCTGPELFNALTVTEVST